MTTKETEKNIQEIWNLFKETDEKFKETDKGMERLEKIVENTSSACC
ncbi:hypothetical protein [Candidatus Kuenenia sp.]